MNSTSLYGRGSHEFDTVLSIFVRAPGLMKRIDACADYKSLLETTKELLNSVTTKRLQAFLTKYELLARKYNVTSIEDDYDNPYWVEINLCFIKCFGKSLWVLDYSQK